MSTNDSNNVGRQDFDVPPEMRLTPEEVEQFNNANHQKNLKVRKHVEARDTHLYPALEAGQGLSEDELQAHLSESLKQLPPDVLRSLYHDNDEKPPPDDTPEIKTISIDDLTDGISDRDKNDRPHPTPEQVHEVVDRECGKSGLHPLTDDPKRDIVEGEFNALFGTYKKAVLFVLSYLRIFMCLDVIYLSEVTTGFVGFLREKLGYFGICGKMNSRYQAIGMMFNPRVYQVIAWWEIQETAAIEGVQDLRAMIASVVRNRTTGKYELKVAVHNKSMMGGVETTSKIRFQQNLRFIEFLHTKLLPLLIEAVGDEIAHELIDRLVITAAGDWNCKGPNNPEMQPLHDDGFQPPFPDDHESTHILGGQLDFAEVKNLGNDHHGVQHVSFYDEPHIKRAFSDHKLTFWRVRRAPAANETPPATTSGAADGGQTPEPKPDNPDN